MNRAALSEAAPAAFDAAAYVADLEAIGCRVVAWRPDGERDRPRYMIGSPQGRGFGRSHLEVMSRWSAAVEACPDYVERVSLYLLGRDGGAS